MEIVITGKASKITNKIVKEAVQFYAPFLMSQRIIETLSIYINFKNPEQIDCRAETDGTYDDQFPTPRMFDIDIKNDLSKRETLLCLAHEMVHVKQYAKGELKDYTRANKARFMNKVYDVPHGDDFNVYTEDYFNYRDTPWEIEAYGREETLYYRFYYYKKKQNHERTTK